MTDIRRLSTRELRRLHRRFRNPLFANVRAEVELELIRREEQANFRIGWIVLALIAIGLWVLVGESFGLLETPH
jgi:hypothetical protein